MKLKPKKCKECLNLFVPQRTLQGCCSPTCAYTYSRKLKVKKDARDWTKQKRELKDKLLTHKDYLQLLQKVFNQYIRLRDKDLGCISCGTRKDVEYAAGHFYPTTYQFLRFNEDNVHKQCNKHCNMMLRGNLNEYRPALELKIGVERLQWLHAHRHDKLDLSIPEIKDLIKFYKLKTKSL